MQVYKQINDDYSCKAQTNNGEGTLNISNNLLIFYCIGRLLGDSAFNWLPSIK